MDDMIEIYKNAFSENFCNNLITQFDLFHDQRLTINNANIRQNSDDRVMYDWSPHHNMNYYTHELAREFFSGIDNCYQIYSNKYEILKSVGIHSPKGMCIQRTGPRQGYHIWHAESGDLPSCNRVLAYTLYLNTVDNGGETEYLYQGKKIKPEQGTVVIWPANITHPHRGNPIYNGFKYIVTGWYSYDQ